MNKLLTLFLAMALLALCTACDSASDHTIQDTQSDANPDATSASLSFQVSECGGFAGGTGGGEGEVFGDPIVQNYCDAEILYWGYNADAGVVSFRDTRAILNCCGEHSVDLEMADGVTMITMIDDPEQGELRCNCSCAFDWEFQIDQVHTDTLSLSLSRIVNEADSQGEAQLIFEGVLDLSEGQGALTIDDQPNGLCIE